MRVQRALSVDNKMLITKYSVDDDDEKKRKQEGFFNEGLKHLHCSLVHKICKVQAH